MQQCPHNEHLWVTSGHQVRLVDGADGHVVGSSDTDSPVTHVTAAFEGAAAATRAADDTLVLFDA